MKKASEIVNSERIARAIQWRFNPLETLTPGSLARAHNAFKRGHLRQAALLWEEIEDTDDMLKSVASKRKRSVSRHGYEIETFDDSEKAKKHAQELEYFYQNLSAVNALDNNVTGGFSLLLRNMMDAVGKRYSVQEMVYEPRTEGLTACFKFVPLWFFENTTGRLRFLETNIAIDGQALDPGQWVIHAGDGIMRACAVAYMFKHFPLQDWLIYSERFSGPAIHGKVDGKPGDESWEAMEEAVTDLSAGDSVVTSLAGELSTIDLNTGDLPFPALIERMDRAMTILWRGADLSTLSSRDSVGASVQTEETDALEEADAADLTSTLRQQVDHYVIQYRTGDDTPLAGIRIKSAQRQDAKIDLEVDKGLHELGYEQDADEIGQRYNRKLKAEIQAEIEDLAAANEDLAAATLAAAEKTGRDALAKAVELDLEPVISRLTDILDNSLDHELIDNLKRFQSEELPELAREILAFPGGAAAIEQIITQGILQGAALAEGQQ